MPAAARRRPPLALPAVVSLLAVGCSGSQTGSAGNPTPTPDAPVASPAASPTGPPPVPPDSPTAAPTAAAAAPPAGSPGSSPAVAPGVDLVPGRVTEITRDLDVPWGLTFLPDGSALVAERDSGRIVHVPAAGGPATPVGSVPGVAADGEGGLLGLAASPRFATDRTVYAYLTAASENRVVALRVAEDLHSLQQERVVLGGIAKAPVHNGGRLRFGPDGNLYIGTGDVSDRANSPNETSLNGKVLRIRPDGSVPAGNPGGTPVFTRGHRNVQGLTFGPDGTAYAAEFGQNTWDELNVLRAGTDYGWPTAEGPDGNGGSRPLFWFATDQASPSGIAWAGNAVWMAGLRGERLWRLPVAGGKRTGDPVAYLDGRYGRLRTVERAPDDSLWVTTSNTDGRGDARAGDDRILRVELVPAAS